MWKAGAHLILDWPFCWGISYTEIMSACQWAQTCRVLTLLLSIIIAYYYFHSELPTSLGDMKRKFMFPKDFRMKVKKSESENHSVMFNSLWSLTVHGSLQVKILEWVTYPFSSGSSWPRNWTRISCITGGFFTSWATMEAQSFRNINPYCPEILWRCLGVHFSP